MSGMKTRESYDEVFYSNQRDGSYKSASVVVPMLVDFFRPGSVLDIGCGVGTWLRAFKDNGVDDVIGVDGAYVSAASLLIPPQQFRAHDLTREVVLDRRFDLAMSLEVAEHLPEECARQIVEVLTYSADVVVFSAAIPDQQGTNHVNE